MVNGYKQSLVEYFKKNLSKGYDADTLRLALIKQGYSKTIVDLSLERAQKEMSLKTTSFSSDEKPQITYEVVGEEDKFITGKKPWWKRIFGL